jgi:Flp pilus assembly protein TadG
MKATNHEGETEHVYTARKRGWLRSWFGARSSAAADEGGALVEMAVTLPVLLLIVTGIFTFGLALNNYLELTDAVGISARLLAISRGQTTDPCATTTAAFYKAAPYLKTTSLSFTFVLNGTSYTGASCSSSSTTTGAAGNLVQGQAAQVTVTYPCNLAVYGKNYAPSCTLTAQTTELVQ